MDTIPRKSTLSVANGTLGTSQTLSVTRKSTSFTHTITVTCGSKSSTICTKSSSTSISFTPPLSWASQNTTGTSVAVTYTIATYNGSTSIGSNKYSVTCSIPSSVKPSCSLTLSDATEKASTYGGYIKGVSKVAVTVNTTTSYGSAIASYSTSVDGSNYTSSSFTTGVLKSSGTISVSATVKDKRGRSGSSTSTIEVLDYSFPSIKLFKVQRCDEDGSNNDKGEYAKVTFSYGVTSLSSKNHCNCSIKYKKVSEPTYTTVEQTSLANNFSVTEAVYIFAADSGSSYNIEISVTDDFATSSSSTSISTGSTIMHWLASGLGMAIGKVAEIENALEVDWDSYFRKSLTIDGISKFSGDASFEADIYDKYDTPIRNGVAMYTGSGDNAIDPDTTLYELVLTDKNTPAGGSMYIHTVFYNQKNATANCAQFAFPYSSNGSMYHRYRYGNSWSEWRRHFNADEKRVYMICGNSVVAATASTSVKIHTDTDVKNAFKNVHGIDITTGKLGNVYAFVMNGDGNAQSAHLEGMTYLNSSYFVVSNTAFAAGNLRVRYCYLCWA